MRFNEDIYKKRTKTWLKYKNLTNFNRFKVCGHSESLLINVLRIKLKRTIILEKVQFVYFFKSTYGSAKYWLWKKASRTLRETARPPFYFFKGIKLKNWKNPYVYIAQPE